MKSAVHGARARGCVPDAAWRALERADRALLAHRISGGASYTYWELSAALDEAVTLFSSHALGIGVLDAGSRVIGRTSGGGR